MFSRALRGALSRRRCAARLTQRNTPLAPPMSPRLAALTENNSKIATGSGLDHSPNAQALYQPTEPEVARRTSAIQLEIWTTAAGPGERKPRRWELPPGTIVS